MRPLLVAAVALGFAVPAFAAEPDGCDKFKWPIDRDRAALAAPDRAELPSGVDRPSAWDKALTLRLKPTDDAGLPMPPERAPAAGRFAGFVRVAAPAAAGSYTLSMASGVWIDVVQGGRFLRPSAFSGATGCDGIRKTMRFDLTAQPFIVQVSGSGDPAVTLWLRPSD